MAIKNKKILVAFLILVIIIGCIWLNQNTGLNAFEKEVLNISLPENIETISMKSGIGDSGGNGDYSTYRVVLLVKTENSIDELRNEFDNRKMTSLTHVSNSGLPFVYITKCESNVFKSNMHFKVVFDEVNEIEDLSNYYFIEFIK